MSLLVIKIRKAAIRNIIQRSQNQNGYSGNNYNNNNYNGNGQNGKNNYNGNNNNGQEGFNTYCILKVEGVRNQTLVQAGYEPVYEQEFLFEVASIDFDLVVEVWQKGWIIDSKIGTMYLALNKIRHSSDEGQGTWFRLYENLEYSQNGERVNDALNQTSHELLMESRFELPLEMSEMEALILQEKLDYIFEQNATNPHFGVDLYGIAQKKREQLLQTGELLPDGTYSEHDSNYNTDDGHKSVGDKSVGDKDKYFGDKSSNFKQTSVDLQSQETESDRMNSEFQSATMSSLNNIDQRNIPQLNAPQIPENSQYNHNQEQHLQNQFNRQNQVNNENQPSQFNNQTQPNQQTQFNYPTNQSNQGIDHIVQPNQPLQTPQNSFLNANLPTTPHLQRLVPSSSQSHLSNPNSRPQSRQQSRPHSRTSLNPNQQAPDGTPMECNLSPAKFRWISAVNKIRSSIHQNRHPFTGEPLETKKPTGGGLLDLIMGVGAAANGGTLDDIMSSNITTDNPFEFELGGGSMPQGGGSAGISSSGSALLKQKNKGAGGTTILSDMAAALTKRTRTSALAQFTKLATKNEQLKKHVYLTSLSALVYPISCTTPHAFEKFSSAKPVWCDECKGMLYGIMRQGLKCKGCGCVCHDRCRDLLNDDCLHRGAERSAEKSHKNSSNSDKYEAQNQKILEAMGKMMNERLKNNPQVFEIMFEAFEFNTDSHKGMVSQAKKAILDGTSQWKCTIKLNIHSAQGLQAKDKTGFSDPYCTIQMGNGPKSKKYRTKTIYNNLNPMWDEEYQFQCTNSSDRIKVRCWDEDHDWQSQLKQKFKRESDDFLGQTIIEVRTLSGEMDVWYNLEKRTDKSVVSGAIRLKIQVLHDESSNSNKNITNYSYTEQYKCLHNIIFAYATSKSKDGSIPNTATSIKNSLLAEPGSQKIQPFFIAHCEEIVSEYALRYGVDSIFQALTHFACLTSRYRDSGVPKMMAELLAQINQHFSKSKKQKESITDEEQAKKDASEVESGNVVAASSDNNRDIYNLITPRNLFAATKYDPDQFSKLLEHLHNSMRIDLSMFRSVFPASDKSRLKDLKYTVELLTSITFFRLKVLETGSTPAIQLVSECIKACMNSTYNFLFNNCEKYIEGGGEKPKKTKKEKKVKKAPKPQKIKNSGIEDSDDDDEELADIEEEEEELEEENEEETNEFDEQNKRSGPTLGSLTFWFELSKHVATVMNEIKKTYKPHINQFGAELDVQMLSSLELFNLLQLDVQEAMMDHSNQRIQEKSMLGTKQIETYSVPNSDYMSLQFRMKWLYTEFVMVHKASLDIKEDEYGILTIGIKGTTSESNKLRIEYPLCFEQFTTDWLEEMLPTNASFAKAAYEKDKNCNFELTNDAVLHSNSVLDIFSVINQNMDILKRLESPIQETSDKYFSLFSKNITSLLSTYADILSQDFRQTYTAQNSALDITKDEIPCILLNNIQQLRIQLEKVYTAMGGDDMAQDAQDILRDQQIALNNRLDDLCFFFGKSFEAQIKKCMNIMASILHQDKTIKLDTVEAADHILKPLLEKLDPTLEFFLGTCEKTILKRILKALWKLVIVQLEKSVVLPRKNTGGLSVFLGQTGANALVGKVSGLSAKVSHSAIIYKLFVFGENVVQKQFGTDTDMIQNIAAGKGPDQYSKELAESMAKIFEPLSSKQCEIIKIVIANLKQYFYNEGFGLKKVYISKSDELSSLEHALSMYNKSGNELISLFVTTQIAQSSIKLGDLSSYGILNVQLELKQQGQKARLGVRINSAVGLKWMMNGFKPYVDCCLLGPGLQNVKHRQATKSKANTLSPKFNEIYQFVFGSKDHPISQYELQFILKDYRAFLNV